MVDRYSVLMGLGAVWNWELKMKCDRSATIVCTGLLFVFSATVIQLISWKLLKYPLDNHMEWTCVIMVLVTQRGHDMDEDDQSGQVRRCHWINQLEL